MMKTTSVLLDVSEHLEPESTEEKIKEFRKYKVNWRGGGQEREGHSRPGQGFQVEIKVKTEIQVKA